MAYRKFKRGRRGRYSRRRFRRSFKTRVRRIAFGIAEKKYFEYFFGGNTSVGGNISLGAMPATKNIVANTAYEALGIFKFVSLVNLIQQGFTENTRIGNRISIKYIQLTINCAFAPPDNDNMAINGCVCRYVVQRIKGPSAASIPDSFGSGVFKGIYAMKNPGYMRTRKTLLDRQIRQAYTTSGNGVNGGTGVPVVQHYIPINRMITYNAVKPITAPMDNADNVLDNDIQMSICCTNTDDCSIAVGVRICYTDA